MARYILQWQRLGYGAMMTNQHQGIVVTDCPVPLKYEDSYIGQLRRLVGKRKLIYIGARAIVSDDQGRILFVRRRDNGDWVMPAGSMELDESILDCVKREVWEETGIEVVSASPIAIYSEPRFASITSYGDPFQLFSVVFVVNEWTGELQRETDETTNAHFFHPDDLPPNLPDLYVETLRDYQMYDGQMIVK